MVHNKNFVSKFVINFIDGHIYLFRLLNCRNIIQYCHIRFLEYISLQITKILYIPPLNPELYFLKDHNLSNRWYNWIIELSYLFSEMCS